MKTSGPRCLLPRARIALFALAMLWIPLPSFAATYVSVAIAPPAIPIYVQPVAPAPGYIWTPGYWAWGPEGYYWVPGTWVSAPFVGALWTPGYWAWGDGVYLWHAGYWGTRVGFYGGVNYGFGYTGYGYHGGYWRGDAFYYNRAANNVNPATIHNTYHTTYNNVTVSRASYNGGAGGTTARPNGAERAYMSQPHTAVTAVQVQHEQAAANHRALVASVNHGHPAIAATPQPGEFNHHGAPRAQAAPVHSTPPNTQAAPMHSTPRNTQAAPLHSTPPNAVRAQAPSSPAFAAPRPGGGPPHGQPKMYADASQAAAHPQGAPQGHPQGKPQGGKNAAGEGGNGEGHHGK